MSRDDFIRAIKIADKGFRKYSTSTTFAERGAHLRKWFDLVHENVDDCIPSHLISCLTLQWPRFSAWRTERPLQRRKGRLSTPQLSSNGSAKKHLVSTATSFPLLSPTPLYSPSNNRSECAESSRRGISRRP